MQRSVKTKVQDIERVADRRDRIIRAAIAVFLEKGFHVATTHDVAKAAQISQSGLYNYVGNKDDVLFMVCESIVELYTAALDLARKENEDPQTLLFQSIRSIISIMYEHRSELRLLYNEVHALGPADRKLIMSMIHGLNVRFQTLLEDYEATYGELRVTNRILASNLISFVPTILSLRSWDLSSMSRAEQEEGLFEFVVSGLGIAAE